MINLLKLVYITLFSFISTENKQNQPKRLYKKEESKITKQQKKYVNKDAIMKLMPLILGITLFIICCYIVYKTGALESTRYYNRLHTL